MEVQNEKHFDARDVSAFSLTWSKKGIHGIRCYDHITTANVTVSLHKSFNERWCYSSYFSFGYFRWSLECKTSSMVNFLFIVKNLLGQIIGVGDVIESWRWSCECCGGRNERIGS
jgi:hypothetical protein